MLEPKIVWQQLEFYAEHNLSKNVRFCPWDLRTSRIVSFNAFMVSKTVKSIWHFAFWWRRRHFATVEKSSRRQRIIKDFMTFVERASWQFLTFFCWKSEKWSITTSTHIQMVPMATLHFWRLLKELLTT